MWSFFPSCPKPLGIHAPQTSDCMCLMDHCWAKQHLHILHSVFPEFISMPRSEPFQPPEQLQGAIISFKILWQKICLLSSLRRERLPKPFVPSPGSAMGFLKIKWPDFEAHSVTASVGQKAGFLSLLKRRELQLASTCFSTLGWAETANVVSWYWHSEKKEFEKGCNLCQDLCYLSQNYRNIQFYLMS